MVKRFFRTCYRAAYDTVMDDGIEHAGFLSFLALLSIFPAIIFIFTIAGALGRKDVGGDALEEIYKILPPDVMNALSPAITDILSGPPPGLVTLAAIGTIWTASGAVQALRNILNRVYKVSNPPHFIFRRLASIAQFVVITFMVIIALFLLTIVPGVLKFLHVDMLLSPLITLIRYFGSAITLFIGISLTYYVLPNIQQKFRNILPGAIICVVLWLGIINLFTIVMSHYTGVNSVYGSLAGVILTLLFFYVMNIVYIFGAEFNYAHEKALGHTIEEKQHGNSP